jgi:hypothetical protein
MLVFLTLRIPLDQAGWLQPDARQMRLLIVETDGQNEAQKNWSVGSKQSRSTDQVENVVLNFCSVSLSVGHPPR